MNKKYSSSPLISVIMPVYNRKLFISEAIESILRQTYENFELIIADDGSSDGSIAIIQEYARQDQRIRPVFFPHRGIPCTSNAAADLVRGSFIARQDSDDIALPDRLAAQFLWLKEKKSIFVVAGLKCFQTDLKISTKKKKITNFLNLTKQLP